MNRLLPSTLIAAFSIFLGSQFTEGILMVPHWKSMPATAFFSYYAQFGPSINSFYTFLTIVAVSIPLGTSGYCFSKNSPAKKYSLASSVFASLVIVLYFCFFKCTNQLFYSATLDAQELQSVLVRWELWHWARMLLEILALAFLIQTFQKLQAEENNKPNSPPTK